MKVSTCISSDKNDLHCHHRKVEARNGFSYIKISLDVKIVYLSLFINFDIC